MKVIQRFGYYMGGFSVGLILLAFFLKGSDTEIPSCDYMPEARVLKNMRNKGYVLSAEVAQEMRKINIDTMNINALLLEGDVDFDKSEPRKKPCGIFFIKSPQSQTTSLEIKVSNCEDKAQIIAIKKT